MTTTTTTTSKEAIASFMIPPIMDVGSQVVPLFTLKHIQSDAGPGGL